METWLTYGLQDFVLFSPKVYFGLFRQANGAAWPFMLLFPFAAAFVVWTAIAGRLIRTGCLVLVLAWVSTILLFLWPYYLPVNWAAEYAIYAFLAQVVLLLLVAGIGLRDKQKSRTGYILMATAILHPLATLLFGRALDQIEVFALAPDPTAIFTLGYLLQFRDRRRVLAVLIPLFWCAFSALTLHALGEPMAVLPLLAAALTIAALVRREIPSALSRPDRAFRQRR